MTRQLTDLNGYAWEEMEEKQISTLSLQRSKTIGKSLDFNLGVWKITEEGQSQL